MSAPTWEQIIDAVIVGDARIGPYIAQQIVKADNRAQTALAQAISPTMPHAPLSALETAVDAEVIVSGVIVNADTDEDVSAADVQMKWLSAHAPEHGVATLQTLALENKRSREADTSPQRRGRGTVRPDSEIIERLLASYSKQRQAVWWWCVDNADSITHDMPSARAVGKGAGVSYETARHVLTDWRNLYGLTLAPVSD
jgi:hypothetical protein